MLKLKEIVAIVNNKVDNAFLTLTRRLTDRVGSESIKNDKINNIGGHYLHDSLPAITGVSNKLRPIQIGQRKSLNRSQNSLKNSRGKMIIRNSASNASHQVQRQLHKKRQILMGEIRQIENQIKNQHTQNYMQKMKRNKTQAQIDFQSHERAAKLVEKMNKQRKQMIEKKTKEALTLKQTVQQSLKKFKQMQQMKKEEQIKKKLEIEKRIENRKYKALQRDRINKMSNQIIKELNSYKISLPDIYYKQHLTIQENSQKQYPEVMLTNIRNDLDTFQVSNDNKTIPRESRVSSFLDQVRLEEEERRRLSENKKQYQKNVRDKQLQFGKKVRYHQKINSDRKKSNSKVKQIHERLKIIQKAIKKPQQVYIQSAAIHQSQEPQQQYEPKQQDQHLTQEWSEK